MTALVYAHRTQTGVHKHAMLHETKQKHKLPLLWNRSINVMNIRTFTLTEWKPGKAAFGVKYYTPLGVYYIVLKDQS